MQVGVATHFIVGGHAQYDETEAQEANSLASIISHRG